MYTKGNIVYADAGNLLVGQRRQGYQLKGTESDFKEVPIKYDDMTFDGKFLLYNNGTLLEVIREGASYGSLKAKLIKIRYSNDDQIAIMLNKDESDEDLLKYEKMQEWRNWAGILAKAMINVITNE